MAMLKDRENDEGIFAEPLIILAGPTAIGKTELALGLAEHYNGEIIGVDSMQIYKYMDIGTAKPTIAERERVPHHLVDYVRPDSPYSAATFVSDCQAAIIEIRQRGRVPFLVGGTGLYFSALQEGIFLMPEVEQSIKDALKQELLAVDGRQRLYEELKSCDPVSAARIHVNDSYRILRALEIYRATGQPWSEFIAAHEAERLQAGNAGRKILKIGLSRDREELYRRINKRVEIMIEQNLLTEVENLLDRGFGPELKPMQSLGYRHMLNYLNHKWSWPEALELLARDTRRYAKRQFTWFKGDQEIHWFNPDQQDEIFSLVNGLIKSK